MSFGKSVIESIHGFFLDLADPGPSDEDIDAALLEGKREEARQLNVGLENDPNRGVNFDESTGQVTHWQSVDADGGEHDDISL